MVRNHICFWSAELISPPGPGIAGLRTLSAFRCDLSTTMQLVKACVKTLKVLELTFRAPEPGEVVSYPHPEVLDTIRLIGEVDYEMIHCLVQASSSSIKALILQNTRKELPEGSVWLQDFPILPS